jgi:hypothetical protein
VKKMLADKNQKLKLLLFSVLLLNASWLTLKNKTLSSQSTQLASLTDGDFNERRLSPDSIKSQVFSACRDGSAVDKHTCISENVGEYRSQLEDSGLNSRQVNQRVKTQIAESVKIARQLVNSSDPEKIEMGLDMVRSLRRESYDSSQISRLDQLERVGEKKYDLQSTRLRRQEEAEMRKEEASLERELRKDSMGGLDGLLNEQSQQNPMANLNPRMNCFGDMCIPSQMGPNSMFSNNRCFNPGYGSAMIGTSPIFQPQANACQSGMPAPMPMPQPMMGMGGGLPFMRPPMYGNSLIPSIGGFGPRPMPGPGGGIPNNSYRVSAGWPTPPIRPFAPSAAPMPSPIFRQGTSL